MRSPTTPTETTRNLQLFVGPLLRIRRAALQLPQEIVLDSLLLDLLVLALVVLNVRHVLAARELRECSCRPLHALLSLATGEFATKRVTVDVFFRCVRILGKTDLHEQFPPLLWGLEG